MKPNIIYIVADDLGSADLGCYSSTAKDAGVDVSPNLDTLAKNGLLLKQAYSNSPVCSPSRFAFMTGCYQYRFRGAAEEPLGSVLRGSTTLGLPPETPTLASMLKDVGYRTALIGKWHLGFAPVFGPRKSGYDYFWGTQSGACDYFTHRDSRGVHDLFENEAETHSDLYITDAFSNQAIDWIEQQNSDTPFLLSLHYNAPHWPWTAREDKQESDRINGKLKHTDGGSLATYWKMIQAMDEGIGHIVEKLKQKNVLDNTIIFFTSDNGGERFSNNWPFVGGKMDLLEGGIRVPAIVHWPKRIPSGQVRQTPTLTMDWTATFLQQAGVDISHLDGQDQSTLFHEEKPKERALFWRMNFRNQRAMRQGAWKYLKVDAHEYLFNIENDQREKANLRDRFPEQLSNMRQSWEQWAQTMPGIPEDAKIFSVYDESEIPKSAY